jgi:hypothetical protein
MLLRESPHDSQVDHLSPSEQAGRKASERANRAERVACFPHHSSRVEALEPLNKCISNWVLIRFRKMRFDPASSIELVVRIRVTKGAWWMPWRRGPKKDVVGCEKPWGAACRH